MAASTPLSHRIPEFPQITTSICGIAGFGLI